MHPRVRELLTYLDEQRAVLSEAFHAISPEWRDRQPARDRWSPAGIVEHIAIVEKRIGGVLAGKIAAARTAGGPPETSTDPVLPAFNVARILDRSRRVTAPDTAAPTGLAAADAWRAVEEGGTIVRDALIAGDGLALDVVTYPHPLFGPLSAYNWFAFIAAHEGRHAAQIREIVDAAVTR